MKAYIIIVVISRHATVLRVAQVARQRACPGWRCFGCVSPIGMPSIIMGDQLTHINRQDRLQDHQWLWSTGSLRPLLLHGTVVKLRTSIVILFVPCQSHVQLHQGAMWYQPSQGPVNAKSHSCRPGSLLQYYFNNRRAGCTSEILIAHCRTLSNVRCMV